jgi:predicted transcriptional regulator
MNDTHEHLQSVSIRIEPSLRQRLEALARAEDRPFSYLVRRALRAEAARRADQQSEQAA